jgi:hypothetical protein
MKKIVSVLVESPFYFTMSLHDRIKLVRRLKKKEKEIDLKDNDYALSSENVIVAELRQA